MKLWRTLLRRQEIARYSIDQYAADLTFAFQGQRYTLAGSSGGWSKTEDIEHSFSSYVSSFYKSNGIVFSIILARMLLFTEARFCWFDVGDNGEDGKAAGRQGLEVLERPWPNAGTGELLARMEQDVSLGGNFFAAREEARLRRLRPDWLTIVLSAPPAEAVESDVVGYWYHPGRSYVNAGEPAPGDAVYLPDEICHWSPIPDPDAQYRGMSWLTPVVREVMGDKAATEHKLNFFNNGATLGAIIAAKENLTPEQFTQWMANFNSQHQGVNNAYRPLFFASPVDVTVTTADMRQLDFKVTQGAGEPLALDTPVPTPTGWTTMGEIQPGDQVIGRDGLPASVLGVSPIHFGRACYRVTFNDRTSVVTDAGHLWAAMDRNTADRDERVYTTEHLRELIAQWKSRGNGGNRIGVPAIEPLKLPARDLLIDPYVLGVWLGDGQTAGAAICGAEEDLAFIAAEIESRGYTVTNWATRPGKVPVIGLPGGVEMALRALGVLGSKHIPVDYLRSSLDQRLDLLRGLMDTDGTVGHTGKETCEYSSKLEHLAQQVADLARSLGYRTTVSEKKDPRSRTGSTWRVTFRANPDMVPFLLPRKVARCVTPVHVKNRAIISIEPVESVPVRCIATGAPDHLFAVGDGWVLTHNTRLCAAGGVPPIIVGLSEGLASSTYSNYGMARRKFGDHWGRPQWRSASSALSTVVEAPRDDLRLGVNTAGIAFLREDAKDLAEIEQIKASTISTYVREGFTAESAIEAVVAQDVSLLQHTGRVSVQLQTPGEQQDQPPDFGALRDEPVRAIAEVDEDAFIARAVAEAIDLVRGKYDVRIPAGNKGGGRFRKLSDRVFEALTDWVNGGEDDDPLDEFNREQLRKVAKELADKARADGDNDRADRLTPRRGASSDEIKLALYKDIRASHRAEGEETPDQPIRGFKLGSPEEARLLVEKELEKQAEQIADLKARDVSQTMLVSRVRGRMTRLRLKPVDASGRELGANDSAQAVGYVWKRPGGDIRLDGPVPDGLSERERVEFEGAKQLAAVALGVEGATPEEVADHRAKQVPGGLPSGADIEVVANRKGLSLTDLAQGQTLTPAGRKALDALGPAGHPRVAAVSGTEEKIREAYRMLAIPGAGTDNYVALENLRKLIGEQVPRSEVDATLQRMMRMPGVDLVPQSYERQNRDTRIPAALMVHGQEINLLHIDDPSLAQPKQFRALDIADELDNRRAGRPGDPMMALLSNAELQAEIDQRSARDPFVAEELAKWKPATPEEVADHRAKQAPAPNFGDILSDSSLTPRQKRMRLKSRGSSQEQIDALVPLTKKPAKPKGVADNQPGQLAPTGDPDALTSGELAALGKLSVAGRPGDGGWVRVGDIAPGDRANLESLAEKGFVQKHAVNGVTMFRVDPRPVEARTPDASGALTGEVLPPTRNADPRLSLNRINRGAIIEGYRNPDGSFGNVPEDGTADPSRVVRIVVQRLDPVDENGKPASGLLQQTHRRIIGHDATTGQRIESEPVSVGSYWSWVMNPDTDTSADIEGELVERADNGEQLHHYWTKGEGLAKWANSPHPWTALYKHLRKYVGSERAKRMAAQWHKEVLGMWPGEKKGDNPVGPG